MIYWYIFINIYGYFLIQRFLFRRKYYFIPIKYLVNKDKVKEYRNAVLNSNNFFWGFRKINFLSFKGKSTWNTYTNAFIFIILFIPFIRVQDFFVVMTNNLDFEYNFILSKVTFSFFYLDIILCFIGVYLFSFFFIKNVSSFHTNTLIPKIFSIVYLNIQKLIVDLYISNISKKIVRREIIIQLLTIFIFICICNVQGMIPYMATVTSYLSNTFYIALALFINIIWMMLRRNKIRFFLSLFMPSGCPVILLLLLIPIEVISYSFRVVSLSVRLFANMMAGHTLLKVIGGFSWEMMSEISQVLINIIPILALFILTGLEFGVAIIQTYIFIVLSSLYLKDIFFKH